MRVARSKETWSTLRLVLGTPISLSVHVQHDGHQGYYVRIMPDEKQCKDDAQMQRRAKLVCETFTYKTLCHAQRYANAHLGKLYALLGTNGADPKKYAASRFTRRDGDSACMARVARCFFG